VISEPPEGKPATQSFWLSVEQQVAAGLILLAAGGIAYIGVTVPRQIDLVLEKQKQVLAQQVYLSGKLKAAEVHLFALERRLIKLELYR
jgi:hypothetical protein